MATLAPERPGMEKKPSHFIDGQEEENIPTSPPSKKVSATKPYINGMNECRKEWEASVGLNADEWWAKVSSQAVVMGW